MTLLAAPVVRLQIASDGRWEDALHVTTGTTDATKVREWLDAAAANLAVEAFFPVANGLAFLGVRLASWRQELQRHMVLRLVSAFIASPGMSAAEWIRTMESSVGGALFRTVPGFLELGKVNAWRSFGSAVFWPNEAMLSPLDSFDRIVASHPRFLAVSDLPLAIEFGFDATLPHWYGHPITVPSEGGYSIAPALVRQLLGAPLGAIA
jgi:hypothetical protein